MSKKLVVGVVGAMVALAGCGGGEVSPETVVVYLPSDNPGDIALRQTQAKAFMKLHPKIPVKITVVPSEGYNEKVFTSIASGNPPDIFGSGDVVIPLIAEKGYAQDLMQYADQEDLEGFYPQVLDGLTYEGELLGLTDNWDTQVMYYNRALFDAAGLDYPDASWTWDDMVDAARDLTEGSGPSKQYGVVMESWFAPLFDQVWSNGGEVFSQDGRSCMLDEGAAPAAVQQVVDLYEEGLSPSPADLTAGSQDPLQTFLSGRAGMWIGSGRWAAYDLQEAPDLDWAIAPRPNGNDHQRANFFHLAMFAISKGSDSPENAWEFLKYITSDEGMRMGISNMQGIPSRVDLAQDPQLAQDPLVTEHDAFEPFTNSLDTAHTAPNLVKFDEAMQEIETALDPVWRGEAEVESALSEGCAGADEVIAEDRG
jgi:multiple sugar transport system substrate-binding protein